jgi:hypothetical protein
MLKQVLLLSIAAALAAPSLGAQVQSIEAARVTAATGPPSIDGRLDDAIWAEAGPATGFVQLQPVPGAPASQRTEVRVVYSDDAIYVGMRMFDAAPDSIVAQLARRDAAGIYSDWAHVYIGSYNDNRTAFGFSVNPRGVKRDVLHFNDTSQDASWDAVWEVATAVDALGWTAEFRIPLSQLRFTTSGEEQIWGINFGREIARLEERSHWAAIQPNSSRFVSFSGELRGLRGLRPPRQIELLPYTVSRYTRAPVQRENPFSEANRLTASAGADVKYGVTSDLTFTATVNPDFGQVEADASQVNLTAYETFFPERRPFFVEGADIFRFDLGQVDIHGNESLFYSRRIGRAPQRQLSVDGFAAVPEASTILGAVKLSGKTSGGWSVGVLSALTAAEGAPAVAAGRDTSFAVEPLTNYSVLRLSRDFRRGGSAVGGIATATQRRIPAGSDLDFLRSGGYLAGLDGRHRFGGNRFELAAGVVGSHVLGSARAIAATQRSAARYFQRPDASHVDLDPTRTSLSGAALTAQVAKIGGGHWRWQALGSLRSPGFEANDAGFLRVADAAAAIGGVRYVRNEPGSWFRSWTARADLGSGWTFGGERYLTAAVVEGNLQLLNFWSTSATMIRYLPALSPVALRGGPGLYTPGGVMGMVSIGTDPRRPVRFRFDTEAQIEDGTGGYGVTARPSLTIRPSHQATFTLEPRLERGASAWQYLRRETVAGEPRYVGGHLEQATVALTARVNYTFTPDLSLQVYAQPFVSAADFSELREVASPRAPGFAERFRPLPADRAAIDADFSRQEFRSNAVLRWEYRPGSALFLVWSQGRQQSLGDGSFGLRRDLNRLFGRDEDHPAAATNVLLVKVSYWFDR